MSGAWIKLEKDRRDDPRVLRMARELRHAAVTLLRDESVFTPNIYVTLVLGCLDVLWCYADTHVREDDTLDLGPDEIDELVGLRGFCRLMPTDWLEIVDEKTVKLPDFHRHNGTEAKKKALSQKRSERYRRAHALPGVTQSSRTSVTEASLDQDRDLDQEKIHTGGARERAARSKPGISQTEHHRRFGEFMAAYPPFSGQSNLIVAETHARNRVQEGVSWDELIAAAKRYAAWVAAGGVSTTAHVMRPETFLSSSARPWAHTWDPPRRITGTLDGAAPRPARPSRYQQIVGEEQVEVIDGPAGH